MRMIFRARRLEQPDNLPVAVYKQKNSFAYITGSRVTALLRKAVKKVYPDISKDDLKKFFQSKSCSKSDALGCLLGISFC